MILISKRDMNTSCSTAKVCLISVLLNDVPLYLIVFVLSVLLLTIFHCI